MLHVFQETQGWREIANHTDRQKEVGGEGKGGVFDIPFVEE